MYLEVEEAEQALEVINQFSEAMKLTNDWCVFKPLIEAYNRRLFEKSKKIEKGLYEFRGYEFLDSYDEQGNGYSKIDQWIAREKPWLKGQGFGSFNTLRDAMPAIDEHLGES